jgi:hypothetical protein
VSRLPNRRKSRQFFKGIDTARGDRTGWLPQKDSNSQMSNANPVSDAKIWKSGGKAGNESHLVGFTHISRNQMHASRCQLVPKASLIVKASGWLERAQFEC